MARHKHKPKKPALPLVTFYVGDPEDALRHHAYYRNVRDAFTLNNSLREFLFVYRNLDLVAVYHWDATYHLWALEHLGSDRTDVVQFASDLEYWARKIWGQP